MSRSRPQREGLGRRVGGALVLAALLLMVATAVGALVAEGMASGDVFSPDLQPVFDRLSFADRLALFLPRSMGVSLTIMILFAVVVLGATQDEEGSPVSRGSDAILSTGFVACLVITAVAAVMAVMVAARVDLNPVLNGDLIQRPGGAALEYLGVAVFAASVAWYVNQILTADEADPAERDIG